MDDQAHGEGGAHYGSVYSGRHADYLDQPQKTQNDASDPLRSQGE